MTTEELKAIEKRVAVAHAILSKKRALEVVTKEFSAPEVGFGYNHRGMIVQINKNGTCTACYQDDELIAYVKEKILEYFTVKIVNLNMEYTNL